MGISLKTPPKHVIGKGWFGKPKNVITCALQARIDRQTQLLLKEMTLESFIMRSHSNILGDFEQEESKMRVLVDRTHVCHVHLAGEGIEHSWCFSKITRGNRRISDCLSKGKLMTQVIRSFSKWVHDYIISYHLLNAYIDAFAESVFKEERESEIAVVKIEKMRKAFKTH